MNVESTLSGREVSNRWPHIGRFLRVDPDGWVEDDYLSFWRVEDTLSPADLAAAYEEWAEFHEWRLEQRAQELAGDYLKRNLVEKWTDDMAYCARRCAAYARGEDPGEAVPSWERRPDLAAASRAIVAEIIAELDAYHQQAGAQATGHLRKAG